MTKHRKFKKLLSKIKKPKLSNKRPKAFRKMFIYVVIVNYNYTEDIIKILHENRSVVRIITFAKGTTSKQRLDMLGLQSDRKNIIMGFVDETNIPEIKTMLQTFLAVNKSANGIAWTLPVKSLVGLKMYGFLTNSL